MELTDARRTLGVGPTADWATVRQAYRDRIRRSHPDVTSGDDRRAVDLNAAYRVLMIAHREGRLIEPDPEAGAGRSTIPDRPVPRPARRGAPDDVRLIGNDTIVLSSPPPVAFARLIEATGAIGEISYLDRSAAIFEAVLRLDDGTSASFVVSLQWRAHDATCEAFCTLESLHRVETLDPGRVLAELVLHLPPDED